MTRYFQLRPPSVFAGLAAREIMPLGKFDFRFSNFVNIPAFFSAVAHILRAKQDESFCL